MKIAIYLLSFIGSTGAFSLPKEVSTRIFKSGYKYNMNDSSNKKGKIGKTFSYVDGTQTIQREQESVVVMEEVEQATKPKLRKKREIVETRVIQDPKNPNKKKVVKKIKVTIYAKKPTSVNKQKNI